MIGSFEYISTKDTPVRSPYVGVDFYADLSAGWNGGVAPAGTNISLLLEWGYTQLDDKNLGKADHIVSDFGLVEIIEYMSLQGADVAVNSVEHSTGEGVASDYLAVNAFNNHMLGGTATWTPDYYNAPDVSHVVHNTRFSNPTRQGVMFQHGFRWSFAFIPEIQHEWIMPVITPPSQI